MLERSAYGSGATHTEGLFDAYSSPSAAPRRVTVPDTIFLADQAGIADGLVEGHYLHPRRGHVSLPVRVWFGPAPDLEGEGDLDRGWRWQIAVAGEILGDERAGEPMAEFGDVWPRCLSHRVAAPETAYRQARIEHARQFDFNDPFGHPRGRIDMLTAPPGF